MLGDWSLVERGWYFGFGWIEVEFEIEIAQYN